MARIQLECEFGNADGRHEPQSLAEFEEGLDHRPVLKLHGPVLTVDTLQDALGTIRPGQNTAVVIDFTEIDELAGPWSIHLALLIHLSKRILVRVLGLHGQPFNVAWLYRNHPVIQEIVGRQLLAGHREAA